MDQEEDQGARSETERHWDQICIALITIATEFDAKFQRANSNRETDPEKWQQTLTKRIIPFKLANRTAPE